jgi:hypothetical protein
MIGAVGGVVPADSCMFDRVESGKPRASADHAGTRASLAGRATPAAFVAALLIGGISEEARTAPQTCADVLRSIEKRLADSGVRHPPLKIVPKNLASGYHVVGSCEGGTQRIVHDADPASAPRDAGGKHAPPKSGTAKP